MKNLTFWSILSLSLLILACDQEVDINDEWEDVGVIYGLLDPNLETNWIRVQRGYLGTEAASASFNSPDSLYYDTLQVYLYGIDSNGDTIESKLLVKDQSVNLDSGTFTTEDFRLYKTDDNQKLDQDLTYHVRVIKVGTNFEETKAFTQLVEPIGPNNTGFRFQDPFPFTTRRPIYNGRIAWWASDRAEMYEIDIYFHYRELDTTTGITVEKSFKIDFETQVNPPAARPQESGKGRAQLYEGIAANVPVNDDVIRFYDKMRFVIWAGGENLRLYTQLNEPIGGLSQTRPEFLQVENGTGMLSSRTRIGVDNIDLAGGTGGVKNTFYLSPVLCDRNFVNVEFNDTCYCELFAGLPEKQCF